MTEKDKGVIIVNHEAAAQHMGEAAPESIGLLIQQEVTKQEEVKRSPLELKFKMEDEEVDFSAFPTLDSEKGNLCEWYDSSNDKGRTVQGNFFRDYFKGTAWGKELKAKLADAELANSKESSHQSKMYAAYVGNTIYLDDEIAMLKARILAGGNLVRSAVGIKQKEKELESKMDDKKVGSQYNVYEDENGREQMKRSKTPFVIFEPGKIGNFSRLNVGQFLKLDLDTALDNGGTYQAVINTLRKGVGKDKTGLKIDAPEKFFAFLRVVANYADYNDDDGRKHIERLRTIMRKDNADEFILDFGDAVMATDTIWAEFEDRYNKLNKARTNATRDLNRTKEAAAA